MLRLWCSCVTGSKTKRHTTVTSEKEDLNDAYIECLEAACKEFDISMPLWQTKHTKQLSMFRKITFLKDDFIDPMPYDKFIVEVLEAR